MKPVLIRRSRVFLLIAIWCCIPCFALIIYIKQIAAPVPPAKNGETEVTVEMLQIVLWSPAIRKELDLGDEQIAKLAMIKRNPFAVPFGEAIKPIKAILDPWQFDLYMQTVYQGLMVRAFRIHDVENALELTREQKEEIVNIQSKMKAKLQFFQDKVNSRKLTDLIALERDTSIFHEVAYRSVLDLLTEKQIQKWEHLSKPVPLRNPNGS